MREPGIAEKTLSRNTGTAALGQALGDQGCIPAASRPGMRIHKKTQSTLEVT